MCSATLWVGLAWSCWASGVGGVWVGAKWSVALLPSVCSQVPWVVGRGGGLAPGGCRVSASHRTMVSCWVLCLSPLGVGQQLPTETALLPSLLCCSPPKRLWSPIHPRTILLGLPAKGVRAVSARPSRSLLALVVWPQDWLLSRCCRGLTSGLLVRPSSSLVLPRVVGEGPWWRGTAIADARLNRCGGRCGIWGQHSSI